MTLRDRLLELTNEWATRADAFWAEPDREEAYRDCIDDLRTLIQLYAIS